MGKRERESRKNYEYSCSDLKLHENTRYLQIQLVYGIILIQMHISNNQKATEFLYAKTVCKSEFVYTNKCVIFIKFRDIYNKNCKI